MAKLSQLVKEMAEVTGVPEATVNQLARQVREAGMISSGGRGPGGAEMTPQDCTNLLLALVSRDRGAGIPARVTTYRASTGWAEWQRYQTENVEGETTTVTLHDYKPEFLSFIPENASLGDLLDGLFERAADGSLLDFLVPGARAGFGSFADAMSDEQAVNRAGRMNIAGVSLEFYPAAYYAQVQITPERYRAAVTIKCRIHSDFLEQAWREDNDADLKVRVSVSERTLLRIGKLIGEDAAK